MRNRMGVLLIVLQVAFTMALIVNAVAIAERQAKVMVVQSGIDEDNIFHVRSSGFAEDFDIRGTIEEDLRQIRGTPGVAYAVQINSVPISGSGMGMGLQTDPGEGIESVGTAVYMVDQQGIDALGVNLIAGDRFSENDVEWSDSTAGGWASKAILSRQLAETMFPDDPGFGVGEVVYIDQNDPLTVTGVVDKLVAAWPGWVNAEHSIMVPQHPVTSDATYLIRAEPGRRDEVMPQIEAMLAERETGRIVQNLLTMQQTRSRTFDGANALVNILGFTVAVLVAITTLGVAGLTSFNITRRIKQIGTRRALGASRSRILRYFLAENLLFTVIGVVFGTALAIAINLWLVESFSVPRFSWVWTPVTMFGLIAMSQLAVLFPARRAARVPPAVATRTV